MAWTEESCFFPNSLSKFTKCLEVKKEHFWATGREWVMGYGLRVENRAHRFVSLHMRAPGTTGQLWGATATFQGRDVLGLTDYMRIRGLKSQLRIPPTLGQTISRMKALAKNTMRMLAGRQQPREGALQSRDELHFISYLSKIDW